MISFIELLELSTVLRVLCKLYDLPLAEAVVSLFRRRIYQVSRAGILFLARELTSLFEHIASEGGDAVLVEDQNISSHDTESPELHEIKD